MQKFKPINYMLIISLVICFITIGTNNVEAANLTDPNEIISKYMNYIDNMQAGSVDNVAASLLNYNSKLPPALVLIYTADEYSQYGIESNLYLEILTCKNEQIVRNYSKIYGYSGAFSEDQEQFNIIKDTKTGIDYIEVNGGRIAQGYEGIYKIFYKFDGNQLINYAHIYGNRNVDLNPDSKMSYEYFINEKKVSKSDYNKIMNSKKLTANLIEKSFDSISYASGLKLLLNEIQPTLYLNHNKINTNPITIDERTLVPLRALLEEMGANIQWNGKTKTVTAIKGETTVIMNIDSKKAIINGRTIELDVPAKLINNSTYIPARFVGESFGYKVDWNGKTKRIDIIGPR